MISQLKKFFLSLIFIVVLCCGLSVSAFAVEYDLQDMSGSYWNGTKRVSFNSGDFPLSRNITYKSSVGELPDNVEFSLPSSFPAGSVVYIRAFFPSYSPVEPVEFIVNFRSGFPSSVNVTYTFSDGKLTSSSESGWGNISDAELIYSNSTPIGVQFAVEFLTICRTIAFRSNFSIPSDGAVYTVSNSSYDDLIISTSPFPTPSISPTLSVTATNITSTSAQLNFTAENLDPTKQYQIRMEEIANPSNSDIIATFSGSETFSDSGVVGPLTPGFTYNSRFTLIEDGVDTSATVDLSFTTLPTVYNPQITASQFSVTSNTFTSTVTLSDLDPTHTYKPFWALYAKSDMTEVVASGYAAEIGEVTGVESYTGYSRVVSLSPSTDYLINWTLLDVTDDKIVSSVSNVEFTTLGDGSGGGAGSSDDSPGILLMILNKVSSILDTLSGGQSEGILASINEKLDALIDTLANPEEQELEDNFKESLTGVNDNFFGDSAKGQAVTVSDVGNLADTQSTVKNIFQSDYTVTDFFNLFSDTSLFAWFSAETALDLNPNAYGGAALADMDDPYNMQSYYENLEKVRGKK